MDMMDSFCNRSDLTDHAINKVSIALNGKIEQLVTLFCPSGNGNLTEQILTACGNRAKIDDCK